MNCSVLAMVPDNAQDEMPEEPYVFTGCTDGANGMYPIMVSKTDYDALRAYAIQQKARAEELAKYIAEAVAAERKRWISICRDHIDDKDPPHKEYEGYKDGWLDACNEIMWTGDSA